MSVHTHRERCDLDSLLHLDDLLAFVRNKSLDVIIRSVHPASDATGAEMMGNNIRNVRVGFGSEARV